MALAAFPRRPMLALICAAPLAVAASAAQAADARSMIQEFGDQMTAVVNGTADPAAKQELLRPTVDAHVDVALVAKFCLGRYWNRASPDQQARYTQVFHSVMLATIAGHIGEYKGVSYSINGLRPAGEDVAVATTILRPNAPAVDVQWVVSSKSGAPKIVDLIAEGTSMRLTQRQDYMSFLSANGGSIDALITAMQAKLKAG